MLDERRSFTVTIIDKDKVSVTVAAPVDGADTVITEEMTLDEALELVEDLYRRYLEGIESVDMTSVQAINRMLNTIYYALGITKLTRLVVAKLFSENCKA